MKIAEGFALSRMLKHLNRDFSHPAQLAQSPKKEWDGNVVNRYGKIRTIRQYINLNDDDDHHHLRTAGRDPYTIFSEHYAPTVQL